MNFEEAAHRIIIAIFIVAFIAVVTLLVVVLVRLIQGAAWC